MAGGRRRGSCSNVGNRAVENENEEVPNNQVQTAATTRVYLDPFEQDGVWFNNGDVVNLISDNIRCNYSEHAPNWKKASSTLKSHWWNWFEQKVTFHPRDKDKVKKAWEAAMKDRLRHMIYRAYHKEENDKPEWISLDLHRKLKKRPIEDPNFTKISEKNSANRMSGSEEKGKALGTHVMGRKNTLQVMDEMAGKDGKDIPSALDLPEKTKKHSKKGWLTKKGSQLFNKIKSKKAQLQSEGIENIDDNEIYYDESGGYDAKGREYGTGPAAPHIWERHRHSTGTTTSTPYTPGFLSRIANENARLKQKEAEQAQRLSAIEEFLSQQGFTTPNCNTGGAFQGQNDFDDNGGDNARLTTTPLTQIPSTFV